MEAQKKHFVLLIQMCRLTRDSECPCHPAFRRLQGKTQLFPSHENDFFRNRLTHSLEVAQVAKSIALRLNAETTLFIKNPICVDLVEFAALAHDVGHPPFGHNGENALDKLMKDHGGFEGNAQTLRLLARLEKKETRLFPSKTAAPTAVSNGQDQRRGLNLTYRTLAAVLKYDRQIPQTEDERLATGTDAKPCKGYYHAEADLVGKIKRHVAKGNRGYFKTIECSIMDISDDIAYSTYDIEDSFKAGFLSPAKILAASDKKKQKIVDGVTRRLEIYYSDRTAAQRAFVIGDLIEILINMFGPLLDSTSVSPQELNRDASIRNLSYVLSSDAFAASDELSDNGYLRTTFTSELVGRFIRSVEVLPNRDRPQLSVARLDVDTFKVVETLKAFAFDNLIDSPRLKLAEQRGNEIIRKIFDSLIENPALMPEDWRDLLLAMDDLTWRRRVVCDYIAGMTDRYCSEMYARLTGAYPVTIYKPH